MDNKKLREVMVKEMLAKIVGDKHGIMRRTMFIVNDCLVATDEFSTEDVNQAWAQFDNLMAEIKAAIEAKPEMTEITEEEKRLGKIGAIKSYRYRTGCDLLTAKRFMDKYHPGHMQDRRQDATPNDPS